MTLQASYIKRDFKFPSRPSIQVTIGRERRLATFKEEFSLDLFRYKLGTPHDRSICKPVQSSNRPVHVTLSRSRSICDRRTSSQLARRSSVCISTEHNYGIGGRENKTRTTEKTSSGRSQLVNNNLDFFSSIDGTVESSYPGASTIATNIEVETSDPRINIFGSVDHKLPRLKEQGFSTEVLNHLRFARLPSSNATYESKWKLFQQFCFDRKIDPFYANAPVVASFLLFLANDRNLSLSTLAGYRSAISRVLLLTTGEDIGHDFILSQLMQSFKRTRPVTAGRIPEWNISLVLKALNTTNNEEIDIKLLTAKTVFLVALASGDRRGALTALTRSSLKVETTSITLNYDSKFIPKSYFVKRNLTRLRSLNIPFITDINFYNVCPGAAVVDYCDRTDTFRSSSQHSLFISHFKDRTNNITPQSISYYVKECIQWCYDREDLPCPTGRAHDVRKVAASLRALSSTSLQDVLEAGDWSSPTTFLKHYFVDVACNVSNNTTNNIVAGRKPLNLLF